MCFSGCRRFCGCGRSCRCMGFGGRGCCGRRGIDGDATVAGKRNLLGGSVFGVGDRALDHIGAGRTVAVYAQRYGPCGAPVAVLGRAEGADCAKPLSFTVIGVGAVDASLQQVKAIGDGGECVVGITSAVVVFIGAGEVGEEDADVQIFPCRHRAVKRFKTGVRLEILLRRLEILLHGRGKGLDLRGIGHEGDQGQGKQ